ncbi:MAG: prephenate dehydrogenase/arogenate dehydrogenase family protein [Candidatus Symbiobacter sp.]|nr:prephenate dehydrogenase/arogenate dehydrogenase family protein [Candidatus Symbiobacter sp.]
MENPPPLGQVVIIGFGLIGSSLARVIRGKNLAFSLVAIDISQTNLDAAKSLNLADDYLYGDFAHESPMNAKLAQALAGADFIVIATPMGAIDQVVGWVKLHAKQTAILTDVGSVKSLVVKAVKQHGLERRFVPGHPIAGTENSGPAAGFAELFQGRWCILTPTLGVTDADALAKVKFLWQQAGSAVEIMTAAHHDRVLAITSHLPHLIAYTTVGTATLLEEDVQGEVIKYSAGGFRDFTRIAASDPIMWRDIFLNNPGPVLEMVQRLQEELALLQRAIRSGDGSALESYFARTRAIRRKIIEAKQA